MSNSGLITVATVVTAESATTRGPASATPPASSHWSWEQLQCLSRSKHIIGRSRDRWHRAIVVCLVLLLICVIIVFVWCLRRGDWKDGDKTSTRPIFTRPVVKLNRKTILTVNVKQMEEHSKPPAPPEGSFISYESSAPPQEQLPPPQRKIRLFEFGRLGFRRIKSENSKPGMDTIQESTSVHEAFV